LQELKDGVDEKKIHEKKGLKAVCVLYLARRIIFLTGRRGRDYVVVIAYHH
jgi:hypothetical protein